MVRLSGFITKDNILFLQGGTRSDAIRHLVDKACATGLAKDRSALESAVIKRERLYPTSIGLGVAIPHARLESINDFFIITGVARKPIAWRELEPGSVELVFLLGCPDPKDKKEKTRSAERYLEIVAALMLLVKNENHRKAIMSARDEQQVAEAVAMFDSRVASLRQI